MEETQRFDLIDAFCLSLCGNFYGTSVSKTDQESDSAQDNVAQASVTNKKEPTKTIDETTIESDMGQSDAMVQSNSPKPIASANLTLTETYHPESPNNRDHNERFNCAEEEEGGMNAEKMTDGSSCVQLSTVDPEVKVSERSSSLIGFISLSVAGSSPDTDAAHTSSKTAANDRNDAPDVTNVEGKQDSTESQGIASESIAEEKFACSPQDGKSKIVPTESPDCSLFKTRSKTNLKTSLEEQEVVKESHAKASEEPVLIIQEGPDVFSQKTVDPREDTQESCERSPDQAMGKKTQVTDEIQCSSVSISEDTATVPPIEMAKKDSLRTEDNHSDKAEKDDRLDMVMSTEQDLESSLPKKDECESTTNDECLLEEEQTHEIMDSCHNVENLEQNQEKEIAQESPGISKASKDNQDIRQAHCQLETEETMVDKKKPKYGVWKKVVKLGGQVKEKLHNEQKPKECPQTRDQKCPNTKPPKPPSKQKRMKRSKMKSLRSLTKRSFLTPIMEQSDDADSRHSEDFSKIAKKDQEMEDIKTQHDDKFEEAEALNTVFAQNSTVEALKGPQIMQEDEVQNSDKAEPLCATESSNEGEKVHKLENTNGTVQKSESSQSSETATSHNPKVKPSATADVSAISSKFPVCEQPEKAMEPLTRRVRSAPMKLPYGMHQTFNAEPSNYVPDGDKEKGNQVAKTTSDHQGNVKDDFDVERYHVFSADSESALEDCTKPADLSKALSQSTQTAASENASGISMISNISDKEDVFSSVYSSSTVTDQESANYDDSELENDSAASELEHIVSIRSYICSIDKDESSEECDNGEEENDDVDNGVVMVEDKAESKKDKKEHKKSKQPQMHGFFLSNRSFGRKKREKLKQEEIERSEKEEQKEDRCHQEEKQVQGDQDEKKMAHTSTEMPMESIQQEEVTDVNAEDDDKSDILMTIKIKNPFSKLKSMKKKIKAHPKRQLKHLKQKLQKQHPEQQAFMPESSATEIRDDDSPSVPMTGTACSGHDNGDFQERE